MDYISKILFTFLFFYISGCEIHSLKESKTPSLFPDQAGILKCVNYVNILSVDNRSLYNDTSHPFTGNTCEITLLPGNHNIKLCFTDIYSGSCGVTSCNPETLELDVIAGHIYSIKTNAAVNKAGCEEGKENIEKFMAIAWWSITQSSILPDIPKLIRDKKTYSLEFIDITDSRLAAIYYDKALIDSKIAKEFQNKNDWTNASIHWKQALDYAELGNIEIRSIAKLKYRYGNALSIVCNYTEALNQLKQSFVLYTNHGGLTHLALISLARLHEIQGNHIQSNNIIKDLTSVYSQDLKLSNAEIIEAIKSKRYESNELLDELDEFDIPVTKDRLTYELSLYGTRCI